MRGFCPREGDSHPRGRRPGGAPLRGRRRSGARPTGEVLVELRAASLNHLDVWIRKGLPSVPKPRILGADGAGVIAGTDERVVINPGIVENGRMHIIGETRDGTHAELIAVPRDDVHPIPGDLSFEEAAAFPLVFETAYRMLVTRARAAGGRMGADLGHRRRRRDRGARDREGARRAGDRHVVERREARAARASSAPTRSSTTSPTTSSRVVKEVTGGGAHVVVDDVGEATWKRTLDAARAGRAHRRLRRDDRPEPARGAAPRLVEAALDPRLDDGDARRLPGRLRPDRRRPHPAGRRQRVPARGRPRRARAARGAASSSARSSSAHSRVGPGAARRALVRRPGWSRRYPVARSMSAAAASVRNDDEPGDPALCSTTCKSDCSRSSTSVPPPSAPRSRHRTRPWSACCSLLRRKDGRAALTNHLPADDELSTGRKTRVRPGVERAQRIAPVSEPR